MYIICYYFAISWLVSLSCHYALFDWFHYLLVCMILSLFDSLHEIVFCNVLSLFWIFSLFCHSSSLICHYFIICILLLALLCCFLSSIWLLCGPYVVILISLFDYSFFEWFLPLFVFCNFICYLCSHVIVFFALVFIWIILPLFVIVMFFYFLSLWCNYSIRFHYCVIILSLFDSFHLLLLCCV